MVLRPYCSQRSGQATNLCTLAIAAAALLVPAAGAQATEPRHPGTTGDTGEKSDDESSDDKASEKTQSPANDPGGNQAGGDAPPPSGD